MSRETSGGRVVRRTESHVVIDDALDAVSFDLLWNWFQVQDLRRVDTLGLAGHWLLEDAHALRGPTVGYGDRWDAEYPTGTPLDGVMDAVVAHAAEAAGLIGRHGDDWGVFSATAAVHPQGVGLLWHRDSAENTGSYTFYAHPRWNVEWGGELLLAAEGHIPPDYGVYFHKLRPTPDSPEGEPWTSHLDNEDASAFLMELGFGEYVLPKPNRLVFIRGGTPHAVGKVKQSAGRNARASVSGFFKRRLA